MSLRGRSTLLMIILTGGLWWTPVLRADECVPPGNRLVAARNGIPPAIFYSVALAESGTRIDALRLSRPWPWTLNVGGEGHFYPSRHAAAQALDVQLAQGRSSNDIGLMQVNWRYHQDRLTSPQGALDPYRNLQVAAEILADCFRGRHDWWAAVGCYHAPNDPARAAGYRDRVRRHWRRITDQG